MTKNKVLVLGASEKPHRYANMAIRSLVAHGHDVIAIGSRPGNVAGVPIQVNWDSIEPIHTISLYLGAARQTDVLENILALKPKRIIFNPGTENTVLETLAAENDIQIVHDCTLVMLNNNAF